MSRTMSGIPTSGGGGDVTLAGGTLAVPQTFTGFNEFDELTQFKTKRPELSDAGGATFPPTDDEFITKLDGSDLFGSLSGSAQLNGGGNTEEDPPQTFTGFNEFDEKVVIKGESLEFTNATRRVIDMTIAPLPNNSNKLLMEAPTTEITMTSGGSKNQLSQVASSSAINTFLQTGTASTINLISQVGVNSTITTDGKFTTATAPSGVNDLCNKAYVDLPRDGEVVGRGYTYYRDVGAYNQGGTGYVNVSQIQVVYTPLYTGSHFKVTLNAIIGPNSYSSGGYTYQGIRLYRNYAHLTEASGTTTGLTSVNANCWIANNRNSQNSRNIALQHGIYIDTDPTFLAGGAIVYSIAVRSAVWNTSSGGNYQNKFNINRMENNDSRFTRPASFIMVEEIYNAP